MTLAPCQGSISSIAWRGKVRVVSRASRQIAKPPSVDEDEPPSSWSMFLMEFRDRPGRFANAVRTTCVALFVILVMEIFQAPDAGVAAGIALVVFVKDSDLTVPFGLVLAVVVCASISVSVVTFMTSLSEPAIRIPLMAIITFGGMFLFKASKAGAPAFLATLIIVRVLPTGDNLLEGSLASRTVSNSATALLPDFLYIPAEEALVHNLLWVTLAFSLRALTATLLNSVAGTDPAVKFRHQMSALLGMLADFCEGLQSSERLKAAAEPGIQPILAQNELAGKLRKRSHNARTGEDLAFAVSRLLLLLLANERVTQLSCGALAHAAELCRDGERAVRANRKLSERHLEPDVIGETSPLMAEFSNTLAKTRSLLERGLGTEPNSAPSTEGDSPFFHADAVTNPDYRQFAMKVTLAVMTCYFFESLTDWSGIGTCIVTCFVIVLAPGQTKNKAVLRFIGAALGGILGFVVIILLVPSMTDIVQLLILAGAVAFPCAWILVGSERMAYAAQQLWFAFTLVVLQDSGPAVHFQPARDRVIGVLLGEIVMAVIMLNLWPRRPGDLIRGKLGEALDSLAGLVAIPTGEATPLVAERLQRRFGTAIAAAAKLMPDGPEPSSVEWRSTSRLIDRRTVLRIQASIIPVAVILGDLNQSSPLTEDLLDYHRDLAAWLRRAADWMRTGREADELSKSLPAPPQKRVSEPAALAEGPHDEVKRRSSFDAWYRILDEDLRTIIDQVGPKQAAFARKTRMSEATA